MLHPLFKPLWFFLLSPTRPTSLSFPLQNVPRSLRQHQTGFHTSDSHHLEMFLISALWSLGLCLLLESFLLDNREVSYPPEHCCAVRKTMFFSNAISSFITTLRRVETKQVKSVLVVYLLPPKAKAKTKKSHRFNPYLNINETTGFCFAPSSKPTVCFIYTVLLNPQIKCVSSTHGHR